MKKLTTTLDRSIIKLYNSDSEHDVDITPIQHRSMTSRRAHTVYGEDTPSQPTAMHRNGGLLEGLQQT
jgi:hypothetical protein